MPNNHNKDGTFVIGNNISPAKGLPKLRTQFNSLLGMVSDTIHAKYDDMPLGVKQQIQYLPNQWDLPKGTTAVHYLALLQLVKQAFPEDGCDIEDKRLSQGAIKEILSRSFPTLKAVEVTDDTQKEFSPLIPDDIINDALNESIEKERKKMIENRINN